MSDLISLYSKVGRLEDASRARDELCGRVLQSPGEISAYGQYCASVALLAAGKMQLRNKLCQDLLDGYEETENKDYAERAAYAFVSAPVPSASADKLVAAAKAVIDRFPGNERVLGAALYRAGDYKLALQAFDESHRRFKPEAWDHCFQAMIHAKLGNRDVAADMLSLARERHIPSEYPIWHAKVETDALLAEAASLLESETAASHK